MVKRGKITSLEYILRCNARLEVGVTPSGGAHLDRAGDNVEEDDLVRSSHLENKPNLIVGHPVPF